MRPRRNRLDSTHAAAPQTSHLPYLEADMAILLDAPARLPSTSSTEPDSAEKRRQKRPYRAFSASGTMTDAPTCVGCGWVFDPTAPAWSPTANLSLSSRSSSPRWGWRHKGSSA